MKALYLIVLAMTLIACQNKKDTNKKQISSDDRLETTFIDNTIAIDILLDPDQKMLYNSRGYTGRMRKNYPEGSELDASHKPLFFR